MRLILVDLASLVERIGFSKAAERLKRSKTTIRNWIKRGVPEKSIGEVQSAWNRSERSRRAAETKKRYYDEGIKRIPSMEILDELTGVESGYTAQRMAERRSFWEANNEEMPEPVKFEMYVEGRFKGAIYYIDRDGNKWRLYTVSKPGEHPKQFWTTENNIIGYESGDEMSEAYGRLKGYDVQIFF